LEAVCEELYSTGNANCELIRPESFSEFCCKVVVGFQRADANWPKLGVIFNIFVEGYKV
jgi:hypothetical protein